MPIETCASITVDASLKDTFDTAASINPSDLIKKHGPLPGIVGGEGHDTPWSHVGQKRNHILSDDSSVNETLVAFQRDQSYTYKITDFTGPFAAVVESAQGEWTFVKIDDANTQIDWTYKFFPRNFLGSALVWLIAKTLWPGYLKNALTRVKEQAEHAD